MANRAVELALLVNNGWTKGIAIRVEQLKLLSSNKTVATAQQRVSLHQIIVVGLLKINLKVIYSMVIHQLVLGFRLF